MTRRTKSARHGRRTARILASAGALALSSRTGATPTIQTLSDSHGSYYLVNNGNITLQLYTTGSLAGKVTSIIYGGQQMVGSKDFYYDIQGTPNISLGSAETYAYRTGSNFVDISAETPASLDLPIDITWHWIFEDNQAGFSSYVTYHHTSAMADFYSAENRLGAQFYNGNLFHYSSITDNFWGYQAAGNADRAQGGWITAETEDMRGIPSEYIKDFETKYDWRSTYQQSKGVTGIFTAPNTSAATGPFTSASSDFGAWTIEDYQTYESWNAGPTHPQTPVADGASIIPSPPGSHFGGPQFNMTGNVDKFYGPILNYFNTGGNITALRANADQYGVGGSLSAQQDAFYNSINLPYYPTAASRGTVTGDMRVSDGSAMGNATIILSTFDPAAYASSPISQEYQRRAAGYNYWVTPNANGTFSLPDVQPGTYRVTVIDPGYYREGTFDNITVTAGNTTALPNMTFNPDINGTGVFQIGKFDRSAGEFRGGNNYNNWLTTNSIPAEFPNGVSYTVNPANPFNDTQNWAQNWPLYQENGDADFYAVHFNLASAPNPNALVTITVSIAAQEFINDLAVLIGSHRVDAGFNHTYDNAPSTYRSGDTSSRVMYRKLTFPGSWLTAGNNTLTFHIVGGNMEWDAVRMDIQNPGTFSASIWDGGTGNFSDASHWGAQQYGYTSVNKGAATINGVANPEYGNDTSTTFADGQTNTAPINNTSTSNYYDAIINGGTITLDTSAAVQKLDLLAGTLQTVSGTPTLTLNDVFNWGGGNITGTGTIAATSTTNLNFSNMLSGGGKVVSTGAVTWNDGANVTITGAGSKWTVPGLALGQGVTNALNVLAGGTLAAGTSAIAVGSTGTITLSSGTISAGSVTNAGTFDSTGGTIALTGAFTNSGSASIDGGLSGTTVTNTAGTLALAGADSYTGATSVTGGVVQFAATTSIGGTGTSVTVGPGGAVSFTPGIATAGFLSRLNTSSTGALALTATDATTSLNFTNGTLASYSNMAIGAVGNVTYSGTYTPANNTYRLGGGGGTLTYAPAISGNAAVTIGNTGSNGAVVLNNANSYTGVTSINGSTLAVSTLATGGNASPIGASGNAATNLVFNGGTLQFSGATASTDRLLTIDANGGTLDAEGTGALSFTNTGATVSGGTGNRTLILTGGSAAANTFSPALSDPSSGALGLTKTGAGAWALGAGVKTYSGDTAVLAGTLSLATGGALPNGAGKGNLDIATGAQFEMNGQDLSINALNDGPAGPITASNPTGWATPNGPGGGTLDNAVGNHTLTIGNGDAGGTFSGVISGGVNLVKLGAGTQLLTGDNTYTGTTLISAGTLQVGIGGTPGSFGPGDGGFTGMLGSGNVTNNATLVFDRGYLTTSSNLITGTGTLKQIANAELVLNGSNTYTGPTIIGAGIANIGLGNATDTGLAFSGDTSINASVLANGGVASSIGKSANAAANLTLDGGTLYYSSTTAASTDRLFTVTQNGGAIYASGALTFTNTGAIVMSGTGNRTLSLGGDAAAASTFDCPVGDPTSGVTTFLKDRGNTWIIAASAVLTYSGDTIISGGVLQLGAGAALPYGAGKGNIQMPFNANSANAGSANSTNTLEMAGNNLQVNGLNGGTTAFVDNNSGTHTFTLGNNNAAGTYAGVIEGGIALVKTGAGVQELSGTNTYSSTTTVSAGTLQVDGILPAASAVTVTGGTLAGSGTVNGTTLLNGNGAASSAATLTLAGTLSVHGAGNSIGTGNVSVTGNAAVSAAGSLAVTGALLGNGTLAVSGTLSGTGVIHKTVTVAAGGAIAPGAPLGTLSADAVTLGGAGHFTFDLDQVTTGNGSQASLQGTSPGANTLAVANTLDLSALTTASPYVIDVNGLSPSTLASGNVTNWNRSNSYSWVIASATAVNNPAAGFSSSLFSINTAGFSNNNPTSGGSFTLTESGDNLVLVYQGAPEPSAAVLVLAAGPMLMGRRRRGAKL